MACCSVSLPRSCRGSIGLYSPQFAWSHGAQCRCQYWVSLMRRIRRSVQSRWDSEQRCTIHVDPQSSGIEAAQAGKMRPLSVAWRHEREASAGAGRDATRVAATSTCAKRVTRQDGHSCSCLPIACAVLISVRMQRGCQASNLQKGHHCRHASNRTQGAHTMQWRWGLALGEWGSARSVDWHDVAGPFPFGVAGRVGRYRKGSCQQFGQCGNSRGSR